MNRNNNNRKNKGNNTKNKQRTRVRANTARPYQRQGFTNDLISTGDIIPRSMRTKLNFTSEGTVLTSVNNFLVRRFRVNSLFDPDPLLGGTQYAGFVAMSALYREYRCTHSEFEWSVVNNEAFPVFVGAVYSNIDTATTIATAQNARDLLENGYGTRSYALAAKGGKDLHSFTGKLALWKLLGNEREYMASPDYAALNINNPVQPMFINLIVIASTGAALGAGVASSFTLRTTCQLFNRQVNLD